MSYVTNFNTPGTTKRVRISKDPPITITTQSKVPPKKTPSDFARDCAAVAVASLPEPTKQLAEHWCAKINTAYAKWYRHHKIMTKRLADPEFIPRSARVNFKLTGSRLVTEHDDFKELASLANNEVDKFQKKLKEIIVGAAKLEDSAFELELATVVATAVISFARVSLIFFTGKHSTSGDLYYLVNEAFRKTVSHLLTSLKRTQVSTLYTELTGFTFEGPSNDLSQVSKSTKLICATFIDQCHRLFVAPIKAFVDADDALDVSAVIDQLTSSVIKGGATAATAMAIDDEPTVSTTQMESLINLSVKKSTDAIRSKFEKELKELAKKSAQGATYGASLKNQKKSTAGSKSGAAPGAVAADKDTPANKTRKSKKSGRGKLNRNIPPKKGAGRTKKN